MLPFENLGAPEDDYFADGIADEIRGKLDLAAGRRGHRARQLDPLQEDDQDAEADRRRAERVVPADGDGALGEGRQARSRVHVSPELVEVSRPDAPTSKWQQPFDAAITDVFQVQSEIATKVAQALGGALGAQEQKQLSEKPTQNLAAYDAFLKGEEIRNSGASDPASLRKEIGFYEQAVALDPGFAQAWAGVSTANSLLYANSTPTPALAERARQAAEKAVALAPNRPEGYLALGYLRTVGLQGLQPRPGAVREGAAPCPRRCLRSQGNGACRAGPRALGCGGGALQAGRAPRSPVGRHVAVPRRRASLRLRRYPEAREAFDRGLALAPANLSLIEDKAMTYLGEGDLAGARAVLKAAPKEVEPTALVAYLANYQDLVWVLDEEQRELLLRLTPSAFDDDRGTWALCLAQAYALKGDAANVRTYAEEARKAYRGAASRSAQ